MPPDPLLERPPEWVGAMAAYPPGSVYLDNYTGVSKYADKSGEARRVKAWARAKDGNVLVPRACAPVPSPDRDRREPGMKVTFPDEMLLGPRPQQEPLVVGLRDLIDKKQSFQIRAGTGVGKTYLGLAAAHHYGRKTLVVLHKEDLFDGWRKDAAQFLGLDSLGLIKQDLVDTQSPVVLASVQTLAKQRLSLRVIKEFGLVIWDECHLVPAETFSRSLSMFPALIRIGLTATDRRDGLDFLTRWHIGPVRLRSEGVPMKPKVFVRKTAWKGPRDRDGRKQNFGPMDGWIWRTFEKCHSRNMMITNFVKDAFAKKRRIIVFSKTIKHLDILMSLCNGVGVPSTAMAKYVGNMTSANREKAKGAKIIFATEKMADTGTDIPELDVCIMAMPRADARQMVGRVLRIKEGKKTPIIIDLLDADSKMFCAWAGKRRDYYRSIGAEIK